jgi:phospholipase C
MILFIGNGINLSLEKKMISKYFNVLLILLFCSFSSLMSSESNSTTAQEFRTLTPIKYLVIIIPENASFDHLFGTYPHALNPSGEPYFKAKPNTPSVNVLSRALLKHNTNLVPPFRLDAAHIATNEPEHHYTELQEDAHGGLLDQFVQVNFGDPTPMAYFDGNTATALWNYAQRFAMSDNFFSTTMTPSTPGHINLISGQTHGAIPANLTLSNGEIVVIDGTLIGDPDPTFDKCSVKPTVEMTGRNVGE